MAEYVLRTTNEPVILTADGTFMTYGVDDFGRTVAESQVARCCEECGEPEGSLDDEVLAEFWDPDAETSRVVHGQCGSDRGWELA